MPRAAKPPGREVGVTPPPHRRFGRPGETSRSRIFSWARAWGPRLLGAGLLVAAGLVLWEEFRNLDFAALEKHMTAWGAGRMLVAALLSAFSFAVLGVLEWLGLRWAGAPRSLGAAFFRSFIVNGLTHSLGANVVVATLARSWAYSGSALRTLPAGATTLFVALSFATGLATLVGVGLGFADADQLSGVRLSLQGGHLIAAGLLIAVGAYLAICAFWPSRRLLWGIQLPSGRYATAQVAIGVLDNMAAASILWMLIGADQAPYATFLFAYAVACLLGQASTVPGGLGVFEGSLTVLLPRAAPDALAAGLIGFRLFYYVVPLTLAIVLALCDMAWVGARGVRS